MKKILSIILSVTLIFGLTGFQTNQSYAASGDRIVVDLDVHAGHVSHDHISRGHSINLVARLYDANNNLVTGDDASMKWSVSHVDGGDCHAFTNGGKNSDYEGQGVISHAYIHVPYTEHAHTIKLHVVSERDPNISVTKTYKITNSKYEHHHTFFYYVKGHHDATGKAPKVKETWHVEDQTYTMTVPKNTYKRTGYKFKYWVDDYGTKFKPGDTITHHRKKHGRMTAVWTKKTYKTISKVKATAKSKTSIKLTWGKVEGATGYNIYRYNPAKKKYVKIKKINKGNTTAWTNKKLKSNKVYKYKIQAVKTVNGKKQNQKKSKTIKARTK